MHEILGTIQSHANPQKARELQRFFKTGKGEYAEGDLFLGITVPIQRQIAKQFRDISLNDVLQLLHSSIHEHRLIALLIMIDQFKRGNELKKKEIFELYMQNTRYINNWDLVDLSAPKIVGEYIRFEDTKRSEVPPKCSDLEHEVGITTLYRFAQSGDLWKKRISIIALFTDIKNHRFDRALSISEILVHDTHDLIHKALGWMLREIGKRGGLKEEEAFLKQYRHAMPRTMLRYAIERFPEDLRQQYLQK